MAARLRSRRSSADVARGFTLLEVMLALTIGTTVLLILSMAIHLQLKFTDAGRTDVEEAQLARAIMRQVADDLRASVFPKPIEVEGASAAFKAAADAAKKAASAAAASSGQQAGGGSGSPQGSSAGASQGRGAAQGGGQGTGTTGGQTGGAATGGGATGGQTGGGATTGGAATGGATGGGGAGGASMGASGGAGAGMSGGSASGGAGGASGSTASGTSGSTTTTTTLITGLYGTAYSLQFDLARVPRVDEWTVMPAGPAASLATLTQPGLDRTSEVKTVAYMLLTGSPLGGTMPASTTGLGQTATGLVRTERDRATAAYARSGATLNVSSGKQELLAPEVTSLAFRYFDGTSWYTAWDSTQMQGIPTAVEIQLGIRSSKTRTGSPEEVSAPAVAGAAAPAANSLTYRMVVQIPVARSGAITKLQLQDDEAEASASGSSGGLGGATGGTSGSTLGSGT
ncbi:MAG: prepilin-type N-terminal cleavage/methylation domain-containing protein [Pirellulales bacterium]